MLPSGATAGPSVKPPSMSAVRVKSHSSRASAETMDSPEGESAFTPADNSETDKRDVNEIIRANLVSVRIVGFPSFGVLDQDGPVTPAYSDRKAKTTTFVDMFLPSPFVTRSRGVSPRTGPTRPGSVFPQKYSTVNFLMSCPSWISVMKQDAVCADCSHRSGSFTSVIHSPAG